ncbi:basic secretory protein-like protein [Paenibacillus sp. MMS18-CY102]|uniref:basic secretory protein-like protein n=1 Tax=Paenibacillus sp. MMS18-CY102 TaxID=2682849 RepID=UPI001365B4E2|nr:basic secretory protein-like protein [Paenibacillus sp. MMS18-CY102]MWC30716.1 carbohydrate-binding protein [Paenibacillus sp. MMS18-CY102]
MKRFFGVMIAIIVFVGLFLSGQGASQAAGVYPIDRSEGGTVTVSEGNSPAGQDKSSAFDSNDLTKWLIFNNTGWIQYQFANSGQYAINAYTIRSANDYPERDPASWTLKGSNDGTSWTLLDTQQSQNFTNRNEAKSYQIANTSLYSYYRFEFTNHSGSILQLAEIELFDGASKSYAPLTPTITASAENAPNEGVAKLYDGTSTTKWLAAQASGYVRFDFAQTIALDGYAITSANDASERDPKSWTLQASNDGVSWTAIDSRSNENFYNRHQRKDYAIAGNQTAYRYYQFNFTNHSGNMLQIGEIEFSYQGDMWHEIAPVIDYHNTDTTYKGTLINQAFPDAEQEVTEIVRKINSLFYANPGEAHFGPKTIHIRVEDSPGVASAGGDRSDADIFISSQHLNNVYNGGKPIREEIIGILYHELTHVYQDNDNGAAPGYMIEGIADAVRFEVGYHDRYSEQVGGTWQDGYGKTGNFIRWIDEHKRPGFLRDINASLSSFDGSTWTANVFSTLAGADVNTLWNEYQISLDHDAPSVPAGLTVAGKTATSITLSWTPSTDNLNVAGYDIYRDNVKVGTASSGTTYIVSGLSEATAYTFFVKAVDTAGNVSGASGSVTSTTNASTQSATIYYKRGFATPYIHYQVDGGSWTVAPGTAMANSEIAGYSKITINLGSAAGLTAAFNNGTGTWDNNNGQNYRFAAGTFTIIGGTITSGTPQPDSITFVVTVPSNTPSNASIYLASNIGSWNPGDANYKLTKNSNGTYSITVSVTAGTAIEYKFTKGTWATEEVSSSGAAIGNRTLTTSGGAQTVNVSVARWKDQ